MIIASTAVSSTTTAIAGPATEGSLVFGARSRNTSNAPASGGTCRSSVRRGRGSVGGGGAGLRGGEGFRRPRGNRAAAGGGLGGFLGGAVGVACVAAPRAARPG